MMRIKDRFQRFSLVVALAAISFFTSQASADIVEFRLKGNGGEGLLSSNVTPDTGSVGEGGIGSTGIIFDTTTNILHVHVEWGTGNGYAGDLTDEITLLHLHGPTPEPPPNAFSQTGPLIVNLANSLSFSSSANDGGVNDDYFINNSDVSGLLRGRTYINVHTDLFPTGEIRGYLVAVVPEPGSSVVLLGLTLVMARRRTR